MSLIGWQSGRRQVLTILSGATESDILDLGVNVRGTGGPSGGYVVDETKAERAYRTLDMVVDGPAALTGTVKPMVCATPTGTFVALQSGGLDITIPAAKSTPLTPITARYLKLVSGGAEGADRDFPITATARQIGR